MASKVALKTREKGAGTIYRDGKRWYLKTRVNGRAKVKMLRDGDGNPVTTEKAAIAAADGYRKILFAESREEIALQIAEARKLKRQSGLLLIEAWEEYLKQPNRPDSGVTTLTKYRSFFQAFVAWLSQNRPAVRRVAEIDRATAEDYLSALWDTGISARTYNAYVQVLRMVFKYLAPPAALDTNPFDDVVKKTTETASRHEFTPEQVNAIFDGFDNGFFYETETEHLTSGRIRERSKTRLEFKPLHAEEMRVLLNLCCWTGCRGQDGCLMRWRNVDMATRQISYIPLKTARKTNHRAVALPMHPQLFEALTAAEAWRNRNKPGEDFIIPAVADRYRRNPSGVQKDVMKIIRCATGLNTTAAASDTFGRRKLAANAYSLHSFRHTFVSFAANAGVPLAVVAEIVGHGNPAMTRHYSHITTEAKRGAIDALPMIGRQTTALLDDPDPLADARRRAIDAIQDADEKTLAAVLELLKA